MTNGTSFFAKVCHLELNRSKTIFTPVSEKRHPTGFCKDAGRGPKLSRSWNSVQSRQRLRILGYPPIFTTEQCEVTKVA